MRKIVVMIAVAGLALAIGAVRVPSTRAQEEPEERRALRREIGPDAQRERREAFIRSLDGVSASSRRRAQLERARRVARFDLDWGLL